MPFSSKKIRQLINACTDNGYYNHMLGLLPHFSQIVRIVRGEVPAKRSFGMPAQHTWDCVPIWSIVTAIY